MLLPQRLLDQDWLGVVVTIPEPQIMQLTGLYLCLRDLAGLHVPACAMLVSPTPVARGTRAEAINHLYPIAPRHSLFHATLSGTDFFRPVPNVVFVMLTKSVSDCTDFVEEIRSGPLDHEMRSPHYPHVTLAQDVNDATLGMALGIGAIVEASWIIPGFRLDRVAPSGTYSSMAPFGFSAPGH